MSITSLVDHKKPFHRGKDSGELDVFEAARYFSGYNDNYALMGGANLSQKVVNKEEKKGYMREGRVSLDVASLKHHYYLHHHSKHSKTEPQHPQQHQHQQQHKSKDKKKCKQPSSPGGKIAQFLNSLFNQTSSKKKKHSKSLSTITTQAMKLDDDDESPVGRRKRRSSISHFSSSNSAVDARSVYSTSSFGFRTPPLPCNLASSTPSKSCKDFRSFSDYKDVLATLSKYNIHGNGYHSKDEKSRGSKNIDCVDNNISRVVEKPKSFNHGYQENREIKKFIYDHDGDDDGGESDSSSDLFELQIDYGFGFCSSGLPVYETTNMDNIKRSSSTAITNCPIKA